jgi:hypothetical protein
MICEEIPNAVPLMQNTDGLETMIPREYVEKYMEICARWEKITNLQLEHDKYDKIILGDVNNYIAVTEDGKSKCKGRFEYKDLALHKNKSFLIIPKAIYAYFVHNIKPEDFLAQNQSIYDYCAGVKAKAGWKFEETCLHKGELSITPLQKIVRYYISKGGCKLIKKHTDGRQIQVEAGEWMQTVINTIDDKISFDTYDINLKYYLEEIYKQIEQVEKVSQKHSVQLTLF